MNKIDINKLPNQAKIQKTIQIHPLITTTVRQYSKDKGIPLQVGYAELLVRGINDYLRRTK